MGVVIPAMSDDKISGINRDETFNLFEDDVIIAEVDLNYDEAKRISRIIRLADRSHPKGYRDFEWFLRLNNKFAKTKIILKNNKAYPAFEILTFLEGFEKHNIDFGSILKPFKSDIKKIKQSKVEFLDIKKWQDELIELGYSKNMYREELLKPRSDFNDNLYKLSMKIKRKIVKDYFCYGTSKVKDLSWVDGNSCFRWNDKLYSNDNWKWIKEWIVENKLDDGLKDENMSWSGTV